MHYRAAHFGSGCRVGICCWRLSGLQADVELLYRDVLFSLHAAVPEPKKLEHGEASEVLGSRLLAISDLKESIFMPPLGPPGISPADVLVEPGNLWSPFGLYSLKVPRNHELFES